MIQPLRSLLALFDVFVDGLAPLVGRLAAGRRWIAVEDGDGFALHRAEAGATRCLGRLAPGVPADRALLAARSGRIELRLDPACILKRTLNLPAAGGAYVDAIIEHRLERLTPWRADKQVYGYLVRPEAGADGSLAVDFAAAASDTVEAARARLAAFGLSASAVGSAAEPLPSPLAIDLWRGRADVGRTRLRRIIAIALIALFATLVPAVLLSQYLLVAATSDSADLDARLAVKQSILRRAVGVGAGEGRDRQLIAAKTDAGSMALLVDHLAAIVPDDTYLRELSVEGERVRLTGRSANAPALIGLLEADPLLAGVAFAAPVTRADDGRQDFDITAVRETPPPTGGTP